MATRASVLIALVLAVIASVSNAFLPANAVARTQICKSTATRSASTAVRASNTPDVDAVIDIMSREFQLTELEDKETAATSVVLNEDGTVSFGETSGPIPTSISGTWLMNTEKQFHMVVTREFEASFPYEVTRTFRGSVEEYMEATETVILAGEIYHSTGGEDTSTLDGQPVGFFKMISSPGDINDSVSQLDKRVVEKHY